jgi:hypothetical protein
MHSYRGTDDLLGDRIQLFFHDAVECNRRAQNRARIALRAPELIVTRVLRVTSVNAETAKHAESFEDGR